MSYEQLEAPDVGKRTMIFENLNSGLFRRKRDLRGRIFLALPKGDWVVPFPVDTEGKLHPYQIKPELDAMLPNPSEEIVVLDLEDLKPFNISKIEWAK